MSSYAAAAAGQATTGHLLVRLPDPLGTFMSVGEPDWSFAHIRLFFSLLASLLTLAPTSKSSLEVTSWHPVDANQENLSNPRFFIRCRMQELLMKAIDHTLGFNVASGLNNVQ